MTVSEYIVKRLVELGITHTFMVTGGGAMYLNDAFGKNSTIKCVFNHHEQACAIAAEGYYRASGRPCVVNVTTGPGGLNTLTGVMGQWTDSIPVIYISGQVNKNLMSSPFGGLRQIGDQECAITGIVNGLVKQSFIIMDPNHCKIIIDKAFRLATTGRKGPVWIDVPFDIQKTIINEDEL